MTTSLAAATVPAARGDHTATVSLTPIRRLIRAALSPDDSNCVAAIYYALDPIVAGSLSNIGEPPAGAHIVGVVHAGRPVCVLPDEVAGITGRYLVARLAGSDAATVTLSGEEDANISGEGTAGALAKFATTTSVDEAIATESGGVISVAGGHIVTGRSRFRTGQSGGWRDLLGPYVTRDTGPTIPALTAIGSGGVYLPKWAIGDTCYSRFHVPHDYAIGTQVYWHVHFTTDGTQTNAVNFSYKFYYARGYGVDAFGFSGAGQTESVSLSPIGTAEIHYIAETGPFTITNLEPDGFIIGVWSRVTNGGVENTNGVFSWECDIHEQSTETTSANRNGPWNT